MGDSRFIAGDWGTSALRLFLCEADGSVADSKEGAGVAAAEGQFSRIFAALIAPWNERCGPLPAVLCGMVGSNIGWHEVPYLPVPATAEAIIEASLSLPSERVHILPGLSCRNRFDAPDYMRGEETQIIGALALETDLRRGAWLLCLPGTHTKWALVRHGKLQELFSAPTGEVFAVLRDHSVLIRNRGASDDGDIAGFEAGVAHFNEFPRAQLLHRLFECRARQLSGEFTPRAAEAYLSGLLIASDVRGALDVLHDEPAEKPVIVIGASALARRYVSALAAAGRGARCMDGSAASLAGLTQAQQRLSRRLA